MMSRYPLLAALLACAASACSQNTPPPEPASFSRPTRVAFVCVDKSKKVDATDHLVSLELCDTRTVAAVTMPPPNPNKNQYALHALVAQSSRGEVAAVDIAARDVIDNRPDIPGSTFLPAGEVPVAIAVAPSFPHTFYVANAGSRDISVLRTESLFKVQGAQSFMKQRVPLQPDGAAAPGAPFDMLVSPKQDALFVSSADAGWLVRIPIKRCADGRVDCAEAGELDTAAMQRIALDESWAKLPEEDFAQQPTEDEAYAYSCSPQPQLLPTRNPPIPLPERTADVGTPEPTGLALDAFCEDAGSCQRRLLIADRRQPIVHVVDLDALEGGDASAAVLKPILTGAPTERVAVTPRVPRDLTSDESAQYVYAIDARDGSVLVAQGDRIRNVSVNPSQRADRLDLGLSQATGAPVAISLAVLTPDFDVLGPADQWVTAGNPPASSNPLVCLDPTHQIRSVRRLRGVFLAVGSTDGSVRIFTVHDMELRACRSCTAGQVAQYNPYVAGFDPYPVVRNRARIGIDYQTATNANLQPLFPTVTPQFEVGGAVIGVRVDGSTNDARAAGLNCVTCGGGMVPSFPQPNQAESVGDAGMPDGEGQGGACERARGQGRVCSLADPFVDPPSWLADFEGAIPGTRGGRGRFVAPGSDGNQSGALEFVGETNFCGAGVLGDDQLPGAGDQLRITAALPSDGLRELTQPDGLQPNEGDLCNALVSARDSDNGAIAFRIRRAYADRLELEPNLDVSQLKNRSTFRNATWEDVQKCFANERLTYQVHARGTFVVQGSGTIGFQHRVIEDPSTRGCRNDPSGDEKRTGRARPGVVFDNGLISFQPRVGNFDPKTLLRLSSVSNTPKLVLNASDIGGTSLLRGVMPVDIHYNPGDRTLYVVDITVRGLLPVSLDPMPSLQSISIQ